MKIAFVTTCRGRLEHLRQTLPRNIWDAHGTAIFVVLDYNDQEGLADYIWTEHAADLRSGRLVYYQNRTAPRFHMAHAKNQAARCAMAEGADIIVTLDADNLTGDGFASYVASKFDGNPVPSFVCPDFDALPPRGQRFNKEDPLRLGRGFAGRLAIRAQDFLKIGGYNNVFDTWRGEDIDLIARLKRAGLKKLAIDPVYLNAIGHNAHIRFKEYPEAKKYENDEIYGITARAHDTVVNYGDIGCGMVFRNFSEKPISLERIPTRIFGLGMQRTGTTSLHHAFQALGFDSGHWRSAEWAQQIWRDMHRWGRSRVLERDYALTDNPIPMLYRKLDEAYPNSKFILTVREEDDWLESVERFWTYEGNSQRWTWDVDGFTHKMHAIVYGTPDFDRQVFLERYRQHNAEVTDYFRGRQNFMRLDIHPGASMVPLCEFLGVPMIDAPFPHKNRAGEL